MITNTKVSKSGVFTDIEIKIAKLPAHTKPELNDFVEFLLMKYGEKISQDPIGFKFDWEGKSSALKSQYSSVQLQHEAMGWRQCI